MFYLLGFSPLVSGKNRMFHSQVKGPFQPINSHVLLCLWKSPDSFSDIQCIIVIQVFPAQTWEDSCREKCLKNSLQQLRCECIPIFWYPEFLIVQADVAFHSLWPQESEIAAFDEIAMFIYSSLK